MLFEEVPESEIEAQFSAENVLDKADQSMDLINTICKAAFLEPRIVDEDPGEDEMTIADVDIDDRSFVFSIAIYGARVLQSFRVGQEEDVEPVRDGEDEPGEGKPPSGN